MSDTNTTVEQFPSVREVIAENLKENSQTQKPTRIKQAEELMQAGFINIHAVLDTISQRNEVVYEQKELGS